MHLIKAGIERFQLRTNLFVLDAFIHIACQQYLQKVTKMKIIIRVCDPKCCGINSLGLS